MDAGSSLSRRAAVKPSPLAGLGHQALDQRIARAEQDERERQAGRMTDAACSASQPAAQQERDRDQPLDDAQKMRCATGASILPPAVIVSITSEPESDEVTKNTITSTMPMNEVIAASGSGVEHDEQLQLQRSVGERLEPLDDLRDRRCRRTRSSRARRRSTG